MPKCSMRTHVNTAIAIAVASISGALAQSPTAPAQPRPPTSEHLQNMESEMLNIRAESEQLGGSGSPARSLENVETGLNQLEDTITQTEGVFRQIGGNLDDLAQLQQQVQDSAIFTASDAKEEGVEEGVARGIGYCLKRACMLGAEKALGWVALAGDVITYGGKVVIRQVNVERIHDLVEQQMITHTDVFNLLGQLRCQQAEERGKAERLRALRERENFLFREISRERARLNQPPMPARSGAQVGRRTDYPGDVKEWEQHIKERPEGSEPIPRPEPMRSTPVQQHSSSAPDRSSTRILELHNALRTPLGLPPLRWDPALAASAASYAQHLAHTGRLVHAPRAGRRDERENLSQGMLHWGPDQMVANWIREKVHFVPGTFPSVSRTGNWADVGHYSQMIWPTTTTVGCGMARGSGSNWLVCRYSPGGNKDGKSVGHRVVMARRNC